jgi:ribosome-associated protein
MSFIIPPDELRFRAARAGGPGGQHVNKTSTKIEVLWDVANTTSLSDTQRQLVMERLANRIDADGVLHVVAAERRSQLQNREMAVARINQLTREALQVPKPRKRTRPPKRAVEERLVDKKKQAEKKDLRKRVRDDER